jgi:hypothetical protein
MLSSGLGFNPFKAAAGLVKKSITVPTKLALRVANDPNVRRAAIQAGESYATQNYAAQVAAGQQYANTARGILHPGAPGAPGQPMGPPVPDGMTEDGGMPGGHGGAGNSHILLYGLVGAGVLVALLMMKK